jgi:ribose transport system substrate-binding protein
MRGLLGRTGSNRLLALLIGALLCVAMGGVLAACGSSSSSSSSSGSTDAAESSGGESSGGEEAGEEAMSEEEGSESAEGESSGAAEIAEVSTEPSKIVQPSIGLKPFKPKAGGEIYNISCDLSIVGCSTGSNQIKAAAKAIGYSFQVCDAGSSPEAPENCFKQAINAKPAGIVVNAVGAEQAAAGYKAAEEAGIPVVGVFTGDPGDGSVAPVQSGADGCYDEGATLAKAISAESEGDANVLFVTETSIGCDAQRQKGFEAEFQKVCSECSYEELQFDLATIENTLPQQIQAALNSNPNLNWIVGVFDQAASIAVTQVQQAAKQEQISVAGMDGNPANVQLMLEGQVQKFDLAFDIGPVAWGGVDAAARIYSGQKVPNEVPNAIPAQPYLLTQENVSGLGESKTWEGPPNFEAEFEELWEK